VNKVILSVLAVALGLVLAYEARGGHGSTNGNHRGKSGRGGASHSRGRKADHRKRDHSREKRPPRPTKFSLGLIRKFNLGLKYVKNRTLDKRYHLKYGRRFSFRVDGVTRTALKYPGRQHRHWRFYTYNTYYRKWLYYDDCTREYYYYCGRRNCYLPSSFFCKVCLGDPDSPECSPCSCSSASEEDEDGDDPDDDDDHCEDCDDAGDDEP
jgi:hypothetical protein